MMVSRKLRWLVLSGILLGTCGLPGFSEAADAGMHVDQVGYLNGYSKTAMVTDTGDTDFSLVDAKTGQTVYEGKLSAAKKDAMSEETLRKADFSSFNKEGTYKLRVGSRESYDFEIGDNVYAVPAVETWRSYTLSRSNTPIDDPVTGLKVKEGHAQDRQAQVYFTDKLNKKGDRLDVSGGWYDAGDYGKYVTTAAISSAELLLAYEANPSHFTRGQLFFPKGTQEETKLPDALQEVQFELDWMRKMQRKDGSMFHKVAGLAWPGFDKSPDTDTQERYIFGSCTSSAAMSGASFAIASRIYAPFDKAYGETMRKSAERIWGYLAKTKNPIYRVDEGQESGSGPYNKSTDIEERIWLAAELFRTTGDKKYEKYLQSVADRFTQKPSFFTWDNTKNALTQGDILLMANQIQPNAAYVEGALSQIHYFFGRNSLDKSFATGMGDNPPEHPHNRIHESTGAYVPGLIVGGPNAVAGGDPDQTAYLKSGHIPVAKSYLDVLTSWSTNEYAIDYTGTAAYALSYFAKPKAMSTDMLKLKRSYPPVMQKRES